jgi:hypothetical protein
MYNLSSLADSFTTGLTINDSHFYENLQIRFIHVSKLCIFISMDPDQPEKNGRKKQQQRETHIKSIEKQTRLPSNVSKGLTGKCSICI